MVKYTDRFVEDDASPDSRGELCLSDKGNDSRLAVRYHSDPDADFWRAYFRRGLYARHSKIAVLVFKLQFWEKVMEKKRDEGDT